MPAGAVRALDVGCGQGVLTRELREKVPSVTGIDLHGPSLELARSHSDDIDYVVGDALTYRCEPGSFEVERLWRKEWCTTPPSCGRCR